MIEPYLLEKVIRDSGASFKENSQSFIFDCPRCRKAGKLYIRKRDGRFTCWVCAESDGFSGSAEWALTELLGTELRDLKEALGLTNYEPTAVQHIQPFLLDPYATEAPPDDREVVEFDTEFVDILADEASPGRNYLADRGIPLPVAVHYQLKYVPRTGRLVIPVIENGKLYGWQMRATRSTEWTDKTTGIERKVPKILTLKTMNKGRHLMFYDNLIGSEHAIVCEGPFDALKCHLAGGAVATMGKLVSDEQVDLILNSGVKRVYIALDPDAQTEVEALHERLSDVEVFLLLPEPHFKDLGEMSMEGVLDCFSTAPRLSRGLVRPVLLSSPRHPA